MSRSLHLKTALTTVTHHGLQPKVFEERPLALHKLLASNMATVTKRTPRAGQTDPELEVGHCCVHA